MKKASVLTWTFLGMLAFQNFDLISPSFELWVQSVDEEKRAEHAQELLGRDFKKSLANRADDGKGLNIAIYNEFRRRLPKADKWQAAPLANLVIQEARKYELDPVFIMAVIAQESSFRRTARGPVGEIGMMQLRPETAAWIAAKHGMAYHGPKTLEQPYVNIKLGIAFVADLRESFDGHANRYVSAYNMGARNVRRMVANQRTPVEYSSKIMKRYHDLYASISRQKIVIAQHDALVTP